MSNNVYIAILIMVMSIITMLLRFLPFIIFSGKKHIPSVVLYLGDVLPSAAIGMLVIYCLKDLTFTIAPYGISTIIASFIVVLTQMIKRNSILSILAGTGSYMLLLSLI